MTPRLPVLFDRLTSLMNGAGTLWVFGLMFLICADIASRNLLNDPIFGVPEIVSHSLVGCVFLQLAHTLITGRITRAELLIARLERSHAGVARLYNGLFNLAGAFVFGLITWGTISEFRKAWIADLYVGVEGVFTMPTWPVYLIVLFSAAVITLTFLIRAGGRFPRLDLQKDWPFLAAALLLLAALAGFAATGLQPVAIGLLSIAAMLIFIYAGMPIGVALMLLSFFGIWILKSDFMLALNTLALAGNEAIKVYVFATVPLFVLMGLFVNESEIGQDSYAVAQWMIGRIKGGLGIATVAANAIFAAITGISIASAAIFTKIAVPSMTDHGYRAQFSVGLVAGSSVLGMLIPPSLLLIVYGVIAEQSVGDLFIAAIIPGVLLATAFALAILAMAHFWPSYVGKPDRRIDKSETPLSAVRKLLPVVILIVIVLGGIYGGIFTPTEAGAAGAFAAMILTIIKGKLDRRSLWRILKETGNVSVAILFLIIAASAYSRMLTLSRVPFEITGWIAGAGFGLYEFLLLYIVILVALGTILESTSILLIVIPLVLPVVASMGGDLIWLGVISVIAVEMGLLTPPLGLSVYVIKSTLDDASLSLAEIFKGAFPFVLIMLAVTIVVVAFPSLSLILL